MKSITNWRDNSSVLQSFEDFNCSLKRSELLKYLSLNRKECKTRVLSFFILNQIPRFNHITCCHLSNHPLMENLLEKLRLVLPEHRQLSCSVSFSQGVVVFDKRWIREKLGKAFVIQLNRSSIKILIVMLLYDIFSHISHRFLVSEIDPLRIVLMKINDCAWKRNWWKLKFEKFTIWDSHPPAHFSHSFRRFSAMLINDLSLNCCACDSCRRDSDFIIPKSSSKCDNALINWSATQVSNSLDGHAIDRNNFMIFSSPSLLLRHLFVTKSSIFHCQAFWSV